MVHQTNMNMFYQVARTAGTAAVAALLNRGPGGGGGGGTVVPRGGKKGRRRNRKKPRRPTYTQTKRKKKKQIIVRQDGNHQSNSMITLRYKPQKISKLASRLSNLNQYTTTSSDQLMTANNQTLHRQYSKAWDHLLNGPDYGALIQTYFNNLPTLDPFYLHTPQTTGQGLKTVINTMTSRTEIINQTLAATWVDIYLLMAKTTGAYEDPGTTWTNAIGSDKGNSGASASGTNPTVNYPGMTPQMCKQFNLTWKTIKKIRVELQPGVTHVHTSRIHLNRIIDYDYFAKYSMIKGLTFAHYIIANGTPVDDTTGTGGTQIVTFAPVKLDFIMKHHYTFRILSEAPSNHFYNNTLGTKTYKDTQTDHVYQANLATDGTPVDLATPGLIA